MHPLNIKVINDWWLRLVITDISEDVVNFATKNFCNMIWNKDFWELLDYLFETIIPFFETDYKISDYFLYRMYELMWYDTFRKNVINWNFKITKLTFIAIFNYLWETESMQLIYEWKLPLSDDIVNYLYNNIRNKYWLALEKWWYTK